MKDCISHVYVQLFQASVTLIRTSVDGPTAWQTSLIGYERKEPQAAGGRDPQTTTPRAAGEPVSTFIPTSDSLLCLSFCVFFCLFNHFSCQSVQLSAHLSTISVYLSICVSFPLSVFSSVRLAWLFILLSCPSDCPPIPLSIYLIPSVHLFVSVFMSVCLPC